MSLEMIAILSTGIINFLGIISVAIKLESRLTRLETESQIYKENINDLWEKIDRREKHV